MVLEVTVPLCRWVWVVLDDRVARAWSLGSTHSAPAWECPWVNSSELAFGQFLIFNVFNRKLELEMVDYRLEMPGNGKLCDF